MLIILINYSWAGNRGQPAEEDQKSTEGPGLPERQGSWDGERTQNGEWKEKEGVWFEKEGG